MAVAAAPADLADKLGISRDAHRVRRSCAAAKGSRAAAAAACESNANLDEAVELYDVAKS